MIERRVCVLGTSAVGKTSLVRRFVERNFDERYRTTIGLRTDEKVLRLDGRELSLSLRDLHGDDEFQSVKSWQLQGVAGYALVADGTRRSTVAAAVALRERLRDDLGDLPFVFLVNKRERDAEWEVGEAELAPLRAAGWTVFETSARTGEGVDEAFEELGRRVLARRSPASAEDDPASVAPDPPTHDANVEEMLAALGVCILQGSRGSVFRLRSLPPDWLLGKYGADFGRGAELDLAALHPFLASFLHAAERIWSGEGPQRLSSGLWTEDDGAGGELTLEAFAVRAPGAGRTLCIARLELTHGLLQQLLQRARETRETLDRVRSEVEKKELLLHCIAHDLKGPLAGIVGNLSMIEAQVLSPERSRELAGNALEQARRQLELIRQVSELFAGELQELEAFETRRAQAPNLIAALRAAADTSRPAYEQRGIDLALRPANGTNGTIPVVGEARRLERVIVNLLENALRHAPPGSAVEVEWAVDGSSARVEVADRGPGVPEELRERLFQKYARSSGSGGLAGLGLFSARTALERWGGSIEYEPRAGGGALFRIRLPIARA